MNYYEKKPSGITANNEANQEIIGNISYEDMYKVPGHTEIVGYPSKHYLNSKERYDKKIYKTALIQKDIQKRLKNIRQEPEKNQIKFIRETLKNYYCLSIKVIEEVVKTIKDIPEDKRDKLIREALHHPLIEVQRKATGMIVLASKDKQEDLKNIVWEKINKTLHDPSSKAQRKEEEMIIWASKDKRSEFINDALNHPLPEIQEKAAEMIVYAIEEERPGLIRQALNHYSIGVQEKAAGMIVWVSEKEQPELEKIVLEKINKALDNPPFEAQKKILGMIKYAPEKERINLFERAINILGDNLITSSLYDNLKKKWFSKEIFPKTGSEINLLGKKLKDKAIIRYISPEAFLIWKSLYEDYKIWRQNGFDYVPIEPIISYHLIRKEKKGKMAVVSGVLDLNLFEWQKKMDPLFMKELKETKDKILTVLNKKGIIHGHDHDANFCLRFYRDENGRPNVKKTPRLYLIDLDQATYS